MSTCFNELLSSGPAADPQAHHRCVVQPGAQPPPRRFDVALLLLLLCGTLTGTAGASPASADAADAADATAAAAAVWDAPAFSMTPEQLLAAAAAVEPVEEWAEADAEEDEETSPPAIERVRWETFFSIDSEGRITMRRYELYRLLTQDGVDGWQSVEERWSPWHQERPRVEARVITPDGVEHRLDPTTLVERPVESISETLHTDDLELLAPLPAVEVGSLVEVEVVVAEHRPFFEPAAARTLPLFIAPVHLVRIAVEVPEGIPVTIVTRLLPEAEPGLRQQVDRQGGRVLHLYEYRRLEDAVEWASSLPPDEAWYPYFTFSTGSSWEQVAQTYSQVVDEALAGADLEELLAPVRSRGGSTVERIDRLLAAVQERVRYTGLEFGEASIVPRPPATTLARRYGDCKDKATLLVGLLRALDVPAYVALLRAGFGVDVEPQLPGMSFNHAIVYVPGEPAIWIDPTDEVARAGELPLTDHDRLALVAAPGTTGLIRTPPARSADHGTISDRHVVLADLGLARLREVIRYRGSAEREQRRQLRQSGLDRLPEQFADYLLEAHLVDDTVEVEVRSDGADELAQPLELTFEVAESGRGVTDLTEAALAVRYQELVDRLPLELRFTLDEDEEPRRQPFRLVAPFVEELVYRIEPPPGFELRELPEEREEVMGPARFEQRFELAEDGTLRGELRFDSGDGVLAAEEVAALRAGVASLLEEEVLVVWFDRSSSLLLAAGRVPEAVAQLHGLAERAPDRALYPVLLSQAYLAGGLGGPALQAAERAVELEPELAMAHRQLAWAVQHDELGRRFRRGEHGGFDRAAALASYREALRLDPEDDIARGDFAILLEYSDEPRRYLAPADDMAEATEQYRRLRERWGASDFDLNLLVNLLWRERFDELLAMAEELERSDVPAQSLVVAARALLDGAPAAARQLRSSDGQRAQILAAASQNLIALRRYPEAAELLRHAGRESAAAAGLLGLADRVASARHWEEIEGSPDQPGDLLLRLLQRALRGEPAEDLLLVESSTGSEEAEDPGALFIDGFASALPVSREDLQLDSLIDLFLASLQSRVTPVDGSTVPEAGAADDEGGGTDLYLVRYRAAGVEAPIQEIVADCAVASCRILTFDVKPELAAPRALALLEQGRRAEAVQLTEWMVEKKFGEEEEERADTPGQFLDLMDDRVAAARHSATVIAALADDASAVDSALELLDATGSAAGADSELAELSDLLTFGVALTAERFEVARQLVDAHLQAEPEEEKWSELRWLLGLREGSVDEMADLLDEELARAPDAGKRRLRAMVASMQGDFDAAIDQLQRLVDAGEELAVDLNQIAWALLLSGRPDEALPIAQRGSELSGHENRGILHTLATAYADLGRPQEARQVLLQSIGAEGGEPDEQDWYVLGRIAEEYGLPAVAQRYYRRLERPEEERERASSTWAMARRRLDLVAAQQ